VIYLKLSKCNWYDAENSEIAVHAPACNIKNFKLKKQHYVIGKI